LFTIDRSALDVIMTIATGNQLAILVKTLQTLKGLADSSCLRQRRPRLRCGATSPRRSPSCSAERMWAT
jgi:hypothetical protein